MVAKNKTNISSFSLYKENILILVTEKINNLKAYNETENSKPSLNNLLRCCNRR